MPAKQRPRSLSLRQLQLAYYSSMLVVLLVALLSALVLERSLVRQTAAASGMVINVSGRQRMLYQRMLKDVTLVSKRNQTPENQHQWMDELVVSAQEWSDAWVYLKGQRGSLVSDALLDPELSGHFATIESDVDQVLVALNPVIERWQRDKTFDATQIEAARLLLLDREPEVMRAEERIVQRYEQLSAERAETTATLVRLLTAAMVAVVALQLFLIMRPLILKLRHQVGEQDRLLANLESMTSELRARETETRKLALVASRTANAVIITNGAGEVEWINDACTMMTGYTLEEMQGRKPGALLQCDKSDPAAVERMRNHIRRAEPFTLELLNRSKDGRDYWVLIECQPIHDDEGNLQNFIAVETDLTERVEAQEEMQRLIGLQRTLLDNAPYGIIATDREGIITVFNPAAERMFGYKASELIGEKQPTMLLDPAQLKERAAQFGAEFHVELEPGFDALVIRNHHQLRNQFDWTFVRRRGVCFPGRLNIAELRTSSGTIAGYIAIASDISEERQVAEALQQAKEQAEAGARSKAEFLANMSHEIRTPLNAVIGMTGLLLDTNLTPEQRDFASTVRTSGEALLALINDILDFSKIDAGRLDFEQVAFGTRRCVEEVGDLVGQRAYEKGLEFAILVHHDVPEHIEGDPTRLRQVLLNLASNAVKFTGEGEVLIEVQTLPCTEEGRTRLRFSVADTGIGIPEDKIHLLFQSFSQADTSTTRRFGGTGLGLVISQRLVSMMGGNISVDSRAGAGSRFSFDLSFPVAAPPPDAGSVKPVELNGFHVLVVDDNPTNRHVLREQLRCWGCLCDEFADSREALAHLQANPTRYRLALIDFQMPLMNGEDLARAIRREKNLERTSMILLTSSPRAGDTRRMREAGFDAFLTKPVKQSQLLEAMRRVLSEAESQPREFAEKRPLLTEERLADLRKSNARLLLVEDNLVNQKVAVRILERAGLRCDVAANGIEAVQAVKRIRYDLILMDCQMPEMDGYEATREIRLLPPPMSKLPIIAMTAEALKGDRERCLEAGMDDYLTKPIDAQHLYRVVEQYLPKQQPREGNETTPSIDLAALDESLGGNQEVLREVLCRFLRTEGELSTALSETLTTGTNAAVVGLAHALAAAAQSVRADHLAMLARELEELARFGRLVGIPTKVGEVIQEGAAIRKLLEPITNCESPAAANRIT
ncbi:response regulator [bacterium]|nr:response regulator [bacterium]